MPLTYSTTHTVFLSGTYTAGAAPTGLAITSTLPSAIPGPASVSDANTDNVFTLDETVTEDQVSTIFFTGTGGDDGEYVGYVEVNGTAYPMFYDAFNFYKVLFDDGTDASAFIAGGTVNLVRANFPPCFAAGTQITTPFGHKNVEDLEAGDLVQTADGRTVEVKWLGYKDIFPTRATPDMQPVRIRANALGHNVPNVDLVITADHALNVEGLLINAGALVNGDTIDFIPLEECEFRIRVYHVETEAHETLLANNTPAESFVDVADRTNFENYQDYVDMYGAERIIPQMDMPRISSQRMVPLSLRARLNICPDRTVKTA